MNSFNQTHMKQIKHKFEEKTGVELAAPRPVRRPLRTAVILAAAILCLTVSAFAISQFSSLSGDELSLSAAYEGDGVVSVQVENKSDKELRFQSAFKLMNWRTGEEVAPLSGAASFSGARIPPHSSGTMTVDLSGAYDLEQLEAPLAEDDWYYLVLTNNNFVFGQDWMCAVTFAPPVPADDEPPAAIAPVDADAKLVESIIAELQPYFEGYTTDPAERNRLSEAYLAQCRELLEQVEGNVVPSVSPVELTVKDSGEGVVFDSTVPPDLQLQLTGLHRRTTDGYDKKIGASDTESALVLSAYIPQRRGEVDGGVDIPLIYVFTYDVNDIESDRDYAFIRGRLMTFGQMEPYKIYEDGQYVCYDMTSLFYSDLRQYVESMVSQRSDVYFDEQIWDRVQNICHYYRENLGTLLGYRDP